MHLGRLRRGDVLKPFKYFDKGSLATIGRLRAVADLPGTWAASQLGWRGCLCTFISSAASANSWW